MDLHEALYTTRAMRRVRPDAVPADAQQRILDAAIRAPSGGNGQNWRFLLVDDPQVRRRLGALYAECIDILWDTIYKDRNAWVKENPDDPEAQAFGRIISSVTWAQQNFHSYPLMLFAFARFDPSGGSIFPAVWSAMLAARAEGVGSSLTTVLAFKSAETLEALGVPEDSGFEMSACVPMGYPTGKWAVAARNPVHTVAYRNAWGAPVGFEIDEPLWP